MKKVITLLTLTVFLSIQMNAQITGIKSYNKVSATQGGFTGEIDNSDYFGYEVEGIGDLDRDGIPDIAVNAYLDDDGYTNAGAVWILFMKADGTVKSYQKISNNTGGFGNELGNTDVFGNAIENIGDLNGDGVTDLAVGAMYDDDGGNGRGCIYILFMNTNGTVSSYQKISDEVGGFDGVLATYDSFGTSIANLGDMDEDGVSDLAVGAWADNDGGTKHGAVWVLFMNANGTVKDEQKISDTQGNFTGVLDYDDRFGYGVECIGDLDRDGINDMVVGSIYDDDGYRDAGAVWVLFMNANGTVKTHQKISMSAGDLSTYVTLAGTDVFGISNEYMGFVNGSTDINLIVSGRNDDDGGVNKGAIYILDLGTDGKVNGAQKISDLTTGFSEQLDPSDYFGTSIARIGDINNNGIDEYVVGAFGDDDGGTDRGAVYIFTFDETPPFVVAQTIIEETPTALGSIELTPSGGAGSFYYFWSDGDQSQNRYNLESGDYTVTIVDTLADSLIVNIKLPTESQFETLANGLSFENNQLIKTGESGWTNGMATLKNQITENTQQGEVIVTVSESGKYWICGLREDSEGSAPASVYLDLDYGFYITSDNELFTYDAAGGLLGFGSVEVGDDLSLEKDGATLKYKKNDVVLRETPLTGDYYKIDFSLKDNGNFGPIKNVKFHYEQVPSTITHSVCFFDNGAITASYNGYRVPGFHIAYTWKDVNSQVIGTGVDASSSISGLAPGTYTVYINNGTGTLISRTYTIAYQVNWIDKILTTANGNTLINNGTGYGTNGGASCNKLPSSTTGWAEFTVNNAINDFLIFGLSDDNPDQTKASIEYGIQLIPHTEYNPIKGSNLPTSWQMYSYQVIENGVVKIVLTDKYKTGDKFTIRRDMNGGIGTITYYKNNATNPFYTSLITTTSLLIVDASMDHPSAIILNANVSFGCRQPFKYNELRKKLDGSYYQVEYGLLRFKYIEKYRSGSLDYKIYNKLNQVIMSSVSNSVQKVYGDNWITIDVNSLIGGVYNEHYILEVLDEKGRKESLRFQLLESTSCD